MTQEFLEPALVGLVISVQMLAVVSVTIARIRCRSSVGMVFQAVFFTALLAVGLTAMVATATGGALWISAAVTLPLMAVGATIDLKNDPIRTF